MSNKLWNGKIISLPVVAVMIICRIINKMCDLTVTLFAKLNLGKCHKSVKIFSPFTYRYPSRIELGKNVVISKGVSAISELDNDKKLIMDDYVSIGIGCRIDFTGGIHLKRNSHLSHNVVILTHDHGYDHRSIPQPKELEIGENVFIGMNSIITHSVSRIGNNCVVGVGSVVTKDIPDNAVVAGVPAKIIKFRDDLK